MTEWLSTRQAAERLGVSEASVRRWSDRGVLPVHRVGRRGERRFRTDHLDRFEQGGRLAPGAAPPRWNAPEIPLGTAILDGYSHLALFYDTDDRRLRLATPFLRDGLLAGEPCLLAARGREADSHLESLRSLGVDVDEALGSGRLTLWNTAASTVDAALRWWEDALWAALSSRPAIIRAVGEATSQRGRLGSVADLLAFEVAINLLTSRFPCLVLCQYDVREFSGPDLLSALRAHPDMLALPLRLLIS